jgi:mRNA interferase YafQ
MRKIEQAGQYKRDLKREAKGQYRATLKNDLDEVLAMLVEDKPLPAKFCDHPLVNKDAQDCHIHPDLVLLYRKPDAETLHLLRLGSHSELGL